MTHTEELFLDEDGIPILTEVVRDDEAEPTDSRLASRVSEMEPREIADELLGNDAFRKHLEKVAATLTHNVCQQMERALQPILEEAITLALNDSNATSYEAVRQQLESSLPELVAEALQGPDDSTNRP
jgi:hypothetical protein